jgi:hypothetical protein
MLKNDQEIMGLKDEKQEIIYLFLCMLWIIGGGV